MTGPHTGIVLKHEIEIDIPFKNFERNVKDFIDKNRLKGKLVYATNSDGKFRVELKEKPEDLKEYILRMSGWREEGILHLQKIYVNATDESLFFQLPGYDEQVEARPIKLYGYVYDFLDLLEAWAADHKGTFNFEYVDGTLPLWDAYNIIKGNQWPNNFTEEQLQVLLLQWER